MMEELSNIADQINALIIGNPTNKNKFCEHIKKVITEAEKYGQYLRSEWQKAKAAGLTQYDKNKDKEKWFFWTALSHRWDYAECVYFAYEELLNVHFYIEGKPKPDPLAYLRSMVWGSVGQAYKGLELLDYQFTLLAIIHDAQSWQAGRERIYFSYTQDTQTTNLADRFCGAIYEHLCSHNGADVLDTIEIALLAVKEKLRASEQKKEEIPPQGNWSKPMSKVDIMKKLSFGLRGYRKLNTFAKDHPVIPSGDSGQLWMIRIDKMPLNLQEKFK